MHSFPFYLGTLVRFHLRRHMYPDANFYRAGGPGTNPVDVKWLDDKLKALLEDGSW